MAYFMNGKKPLDVAMVGFKLLEIVAPFSARKRELE